MATETISAQNAYELSHTECDIYFIIFGYFQQPVTQVPGKMTILLDKPVVNILPIIDG